MKEIKKITYLNNKIFAFDDEYIELGKDIVDKNYKVSKILKEDKRSYVALIEIHNKKYILKEPKNEHRLAQRKMLTFFKKGEALTTLLNVSALIDKGISEYAIPYVAITKRKNGCIIYSALLSEYVGDISVGDVKEKALSTFYRQKIVDICKKIHSLGHYHGDMNVFNFNVLNNNIKVLDTQGKKMILGNYRAHYDMLTYMTEHFKQMQYPYKKNFWYYVAFFEKKIKHLRCYRYYKLRKQRKRNKKS